MRRKVFRVVGTFLILAWPSLLPSYCDSQIIRVSDIVYGIADGVELKLDLARPSTGKGPFPALVYIHSGGWGYYSGFSKSECSLLIEKAAGKGYVAVAVDFRQLTRHWDDGKLTWKYPFPAQVYDLKCAVRWLRANSRKYNIDSNHVGADCGNLTLTSRIEAAVSSAGATDMVSAYSLGPLLLDALLGGPPEKFPEVYAKASPLSYVTKDDPPILLINGDEDRDVPPTQARLLDAKLTKVGVLHTLIRKKGRYHEGLWNEDEVWDFLDKNLKK